MRYMYTPPTGATGFVVVAETDADLSLLSLVSTRLLERYIVYTLYIKPDEGGKQYFALFIGCNPEETYTVQSEVEGILQSAN